MTTRVGAVSYLNTKPLIFGLERRLTDCELILDLPSRLADSLSAEQLDVALIPSVEFLRSNRYSIVSDACIACRGAVRSVRLLFRTPPARVKTLSLDEGSRTSAVLAQVLLAKRFGIFPQLQPLGIHSGLDSVRTDAILVIGDRAMEIEAADYVATWDLGEEWTCDTGLPFVFAMWVASDSGLETRVIDALQASRDDGLESIDAIVRDEAPRYGLSAEQCRKYFIEQLHFTLGLRELEGLNLFRQQAVDLALLTPSSIEVK